MSQPDRLPCGIADVVELAGIRVIRNTGTQMHCRCPFCNDTKAHLNIRLDKDVFRCNRCGRGGGVLQLYAGIYDTDISTACGELRRIFSGSGTVRPKPHNMQETAGTELPVAPGAVRDNTYRSLLSLLSLAAAHRESLLSRGLSGEDIDRLGYRTTPAVRGPKIVSELLRRGCTLDGVPGFYRDRVSGRWKLDIRGSGIMIPDRNVNGEIEALQIRQDAVRKSKFLTLTSVDNYCGTTASCCPHFVGFRDSTRTAYVTEGVMKADIAHYLSLERGNPIAFVGLTGVSNYNQFQRALGELKTLGITRICLAFDTDDLTNENVRNAKKRVLTMGLECGFEMIPVRWDPVYKGIDDMLVGFRGKRTDVLRPEPFGIHI